MSQLNIPSIMSAIGSTVGNGLVSVAVGTAGVQLAQALQNSSRQTLYNQNNGLFTEYQLSVYYRTKQCILQLPTATPAGGSPKSSIVQWANPIADAIVEFSATSAGTWPLIPDPVMQDPNMILLEQVVFPESPTTRADGSDPQYRISGKYTYALVDPTKLVMRAGLMPWMTDNGNIVTIVPPTVFSQNIFGTQKTFSIAEIPTVGG